jgi:hypothetical protein
VASLSIGRQVHFDDAAGLGQKLRQGLRGRGSVQIPDEDTSWNGSPPPGRPWIVPRGPSEPVSRPGAERPEPSRRLISSREHANTERPRRFSASHESQPSFASDSATFSRPKEAGGLSAARLDRGSNPTPPMIRVTMRLIVPPSGSSGRTDESPLPLLA